MKFSKEISEEISKDISLKLSPPQKKNIYIYI